jgi:hypothetical protein
MQVLYFCSKRDIHTGPAWYRCCSLVVMVSNRSLKLSLVSSQSPNGLPDSWRYSSLLDSSKWHWLLQTCLGSVPFAWIMLPSFSHLVAQFPVPSPICLFTFEHHHFSPEDGGSMFVWNVGMYLKSTQHYNPEDKNWQCDITCYLFMGMKLGPLILREEQKVRTLQNRVLKRIFGQRVTNWQQIGENT